MKGAGQKEHERRRNLPALTPVFPYQKSSCALILKNRADMIDNGLRYVASP